MPTAIPIWFKALLTTALCVALQPSLAVAFTTLVSQEPPISVDRARGIELFKQERFNEAIVALQRALKKDEQDFEAWYFVGLALARTGDLKNGTKSIERAVKLNPSSAAAHNGLAYVFLLRNKLADVVSEAHATINIDPRLAEPHYFIGVARLRAYARQEALAEAETAIKLDPRYPAAYLLKSQALVSFVGEVVVSDPPQSLDEKARARYPQAGTAQDRYREAATALERYLELDPDSENKQTWVEQLESLKVYSGSHPANDEDLPHSGREITDKARILSKPAAGYTEAARQNQISGTVVLKAVLAADGTVKHIMIVKGLPNGLTERCIRAARGIKFSPATIDGRPVSQFIQLEYTFNLY